MKQIACLRIVAILSLMVPTWLALGPEACTAQTLADKQEELPALLKAEPLEQAPADNELQKLLKDRYNAALKATQASTKDYLAGRGTLDLVLEQAKQLLTSELQLTDVPREQASALEKHLQLAQYIEKVCKVRYEAGKLSSADYERARYFRLDTEIQLLRAKQQAESPRPK
jgi:outer membrane protein TolC